MVDLVDALYEKDTLLSTPDEDGKLKEQHQEAFQSVLSIVQGPSGDDPKALSLAIQLVVKHVFHFPQHLTDTLTSLVAVCGNKEQPRMILLAAARGLETLSRGPRDLVQEAVFRPPLVSLRAASKDLLVKRALDECLESLKKPAAEVKTTASPPKPAAEATPKASPPGAVEATTNGSSAPEEKEAPQQSPPAAAKPTRIKGAGKDVKGYQELLKELRPYIRLCDDAPRKCLPREVVQSSLAHAHLLKRLTSLEGLPKFVYSEHIVKLMETVEGVIRERGGVVEIPKDDADEVPVSLPQGGSGAVGRVEDVGDCFYQMETKHITPFLCIKNVFSRASKTDIFRLIEGHLDGYKLRPNELNILRRGKIIHALANVGSIQRATHLRDQIDGMQFHGRKLEVNYTVGPPSRAIFVGNIDGVDEKDLRDLIESFGVKPERVNHHEGKGMRKADIKFFTVADAVKVIRNLAENNLHFGRRVSYNFSIGHVPDKVGATVMATSPSSPVSMPDSGNKTTNLRRSVAVDPSSTNQKEAGAAGSQPEQGVGYTLQLVSGAKSVSSTPSISHTRPRDRNRGRSVSEAGSSDTRRGRSGSRGGGSSPRRSPEQRRQGHRDEPEQENRAEAAQTDEDRAPSDSGDRRPVEDGDSPKRSSVEDEEASKSPEPRREESSPLPSSRASSDGGRASPVRAPSPFGSLGGDDSDYGDIDDGGSPDQSEGVVEERANGGDAGRSSRGSRSRSRSSSRSRSRSRSRGRRRSPSRSRSRGMDGSRALRNAGPPSGRLPPRDFRPSYRGGRMMPSPPRDERSRSGYPVMQREERRARSRSPRREGAREWSRGRENRRDRDNRGPVTSGDAWKEDSSKSPERRRDHSSGPLPSSRSPPYPYKEDRGRKRSPPFPLSRMDDRGSPKRRRERSPVSPRRQQMDDGYFRGPPRRPPSPVSSSSRRYPASPASPPRDRGRRAMRRSSSRERLPVGLETSRGRSYPPPPPPPPDMGRGSRGYPSDYAAPMKRRSASPPPSYYSSSRRPPSPPPMSSRSRPPGGRDRDRSLSPPPSRSKSYHHRSPPRGRGGPLSPVYRRDPPPMYRSSRR